LVAYHEAGTSGRIEPTSLLFPPAGGRVSPLIDVRTEKAKNALTTYAKTRNHGVREMNLLKLLLPLGVEAHELDLTWLASIDSWGSGRGDYAHQSSTKLQTLSDPQDELRTARALLQGFKHIDQILGEL
jgi:hypothetical protein